MTREELQLVAERYVDAWRRHDPAAIARFHVPEGVAESPIYATLRGRQAIEDAARSFVSSFSDVDMAIDAILVDAGRVAIFTTVTATHVNEFFGMPGTNRRIEFRSAQLLDIDGDGQIVHERRIYDFTGLLVQVGILRARPAKP